MCRYFGRCTNQCTSPRFGNRRAEESAHSNDQIIKPLGILEGGGLEALLCGFAASAAAAAAASCSFFAALRAALLLVRGAMLGGREILLGRDLSFGLSAASGAGEGRAFVFEVSWPLPLAVTALSILKAANGRAIVDDGRDTGGDLPR